MKNFSITPGCIETSTHVYRRHVIQEHKLRMHHRTQKENKELALEICRVLVKIQFCHDINSFEGSSILNLSGQKGTHNL